MMYVVLLLVVLVLGISYAWFDFSIEGDEASSNWITTAVLGLKYTEEPISSSGDFIPGNSFNHTFYIENIGDGVANYHIYLVDIVNTYTVKGDFTYTLSCEVIDNNTKAKIGDCPGIENDKEVPSYDEYVMGNSIDVQTTHKYVMTFKLSDESSDKVYSLGKRFQGRILVLGDEVAINPPSSNIGVTFSPNGNNVYSSTQSTQVSVNSNIQIEKLTYVWSNSNAKSGSLGSNFVNGSTITSPEFNEDMYLCIYVLDIMGNEYDECSNIFKLYNPFTYKDFAYTGDYEEFIVPLTGWYRFEAWGGKWWRIGRISRQRWLYNRSNIFNKK